MQNPADNGKGFAIGSLVCGIIGIITCAVPALPIVLGILAIIFGNMAKKKLPAGETGMATAGFICGIVAVILAVIILIVLAVMLAIVGTAVATGLSYYDWLYY